MRPAAAEWRQSSILVIEDDLGDQRIIQQALGHADLRIVSDGAEAIDYLRRQGRYAAPADSPRPRLILLDLQLPGRDGKQVLAAARGRAELRYTPIVVVTSSMRETDIAECYALGCSSYVIKPLGFQAFTESLQAIHDYWLDVVTLPSSEPLRGEGGMNAGRERDEPPAPGPSDG